MVHPGQRDLAVRGFEVMFKFTLTDFSVKVNLSFKHKPAPTTSNSYSNYPIKGSCLYMPILRMLWSRHATSPAASFSREQQQCLSADGTHRLTVVGCFSSPLNLPLRVDHANWPECSENTYTHHSFTG